MSLFLWKKLEKKLNFHNFYGWEFEFICFCCILIKHKYRLRTKDVRYLTKKRQYIVRWFFGFRWIKQYPNRQFNQVSCHIGVKLSKNATTRNQLRRVIMNYIRDNNIETTSINWEFYKIFINLDKNKLSELIQYMQEYNKAEWNIYFQKQFESAFTSFKLYLCGKN